MAARVRYKPNFSFVRHKIPQAKRQTAGRQGALIRTIARRSIRKRKKVSQPGSPPTDRTGLLKRFIFFSWDEGSQSVIVGPEKLSSKQGAVPKLLEYGGYGLNRQRERVRYKARPTMQLALDAAKAKLPELWKGAF